MKVLVVTPSLDIDRFRGIARFSSELIRELEKNSSIEIEILEVFNDGKKRYTRSLTKVPLKELFSKVNIIHSLTPENAFFSKLLKYVSGKKTVVTFHDAIPLEYHKNLEYKNKYIPQLLKVLWFGATKADRLVSVSSTTKYKIEKIFRTKIDRIINPGISNVFKEKRKHNLSNKVITIGFISPFTKRKGVQYAIKVYEYLKKKIDLRLILAGGNIENLYHKQFFLKYKTNIHNDKNIKIIGYVSDKKLVEVYNKLDFFIFPSIAEGFGFPILEAQRCGVPTLIFSWADIPEETKKYAIKSENFVSMANKILKLIEGKKTYKRISREGKKYSKLFTWEKQQKNILAYIITCIKQNKISIFVFN